MNNTISYLMLLIMSIPFILLMLNNIQAIIKKKDESKLFLNEFINYFLKLIEKTILLFMIILIVVFLFSIIIKPLVFLDFTSKYILETFIISWTLSFFYKNSNEQNNNKLNELE